jgi:hypothetical protein
MSEWIPIQDGDFIVADVIRWKEGVYAQQRSRKRKAPRLGDRLMTAEVLYGPDARGWVRLLVRKCEILTELSVKKPSKIMAMTEIRRAARTILRGTPERLLWSDESARTLVAGKCLTREGQDAPERN